MSPTLHNSRHDSKPTEHAFVSCSAAQPVLCVPQFYAQTQQVDPRALVCPIATG